MLPAWTTDDYLGVILVLAVVLIWPVRHHCNSWYYTLLARFYGLAALLARPKFFVFGIFLYLIAEDVYHATVRALTPWVPFKLYLAKFAAQLETVPIKYAAVPESPRINNRLLAWMREDAGEDQESKSVTRERQRLIKQKIREKYRSLASENPDREIIDWSLFEMEERGRIGL